jgi:hypothetical protein
VGSVQLQGTLAYLRLQQPMPSTLAVPLCTDSHSPLSNTHILSLTGRKACCSHHCVPLGGFGMDLS